ncbi:uncharacterized protein [Typha latifolia]|uniref:uncharacterized protein n=1 Tax=Typha latifolia TaxID=4733 RepID=UPI003C2AFE1B
MASPFPTPPYISHPLQASNAATLPLRFPRITILFFCSLVLFTCLSLAFAFTFAFLFFSSLSSISTANPLLPSSRPLSNLSRPVVLLISSDGFRFGYQFKAPTPNIRRLISNGTEAEEGLIPVFPTSTFPNHYSIVTGLYPSYHGIIYNYFVDPVSGEQFTTRSHEPMWWLGEPLWETVVAQGFNAAAYFWPGSEVIKGPWTCSPNVCPKYNFSVPFEERVDTVLGYFDLPKDEIPVFIALYFEDPDSQGHVVGPDDPRITDAVVRIDKMIGRLIDGLEERGIFEDVSIILLGDHGMVGTCDKKLIFLDDLSPWIQIPSSWVRSYSPLLSIQPPPDMSLSEVVAKMNEGLTSGKVNNGEYLKIFLKEDLPDRLHYSDSYRIPSIIGLVGEGYTVEQRRTERKECGGAHGYDNAFFSMRTIFVAHGPQFDRGRKIPSFENVEIYNLITSVLKLKGAPNNGSASFPNSILLPSD